MKRRAILGWLMGMVSWCAPLGAAPSVGFSLWDYPACSGAPRSFNIFADVSTDNGGLLSFGLDLQGNITSLYNLAPAAHYTKTGSPSKSAGFLAQRIEDSSSGQVAGIQNLGAQANLVPIFGFGQEGGDLSAQAPIGPLPAGYTYSDESSHLIGSAYAARLLLASGSGTNFDWEAGSSETRAIVFVSRSGTSNTVAQIQTHHIIVDTFCDVADAWLSNNPGGNLQPDSFIEVHGRGGAYESVVHTLDEFNARGSVAIQTIGDDGGSVYVMAKLLGDSKTINQLLADVQEDVGPEDSQFIALHSRYDGNFIGGSFNALFKVSNVTGAKFFSWDFTRYAGVSLVQVAAVPEPGVISLTLSGLLVLNLRTRRPMRG